MDRLAHNVLQQASFSFVHDDYAFPKNYTKRQAREKRDWKGTKYQRLRCSLTHSLYNDVRVRTDVGQRTT